MEGAGRQIIGPLRFSGTELPKRRMPWIREDTDRPTFAGPGGALQSDGARGNVDRDVVTGTLSVPHVDSRLELFTDETS